MKVFFKKLKKCNKAEVTLYFLTLVLFLIGYIFFIKSILSLAGIETILRVFVIVLLSAWALYFPLAGILAMFEKKHKRFVKLTILNTIIIPIIFLVSIIINGIYHRIDGFSKDYLTYTSALVTLKDTKWDEEKKIGMIDDENDIEGYVLAKDLLKKEKLKNETVSYDDYVEMLLDLKEQKIDGILISSNYAVSYQEEGIFENITKDTKIQFEYSKKMKNKDNEITSNKDLTEPFTILLLGVDSAKDGLDKNQAFNGDTMMMITFNPHTLNATMFSIPRDIYVPIACRNGAMAKINSSAARGTECVIDTIKNVTDIDIDYYVKVNFKAVVDLVDALGGITVDVKKPDYNQYNGKVCEQNSDRQFGPKLVCMDPGIQTLNGEQALAYSRCRHLYTYSDIDRIKHQQQVVEALAQKIKNIRSLNDFEKILGVVENNMDTNMSANKILSLYDVAKDVLLTSLTSDDDLITIQKSYLEFYDLPVQRPDGSTSSALGYYKSSMEDITKMMKQNLELIEVTPVKTFSFSYEENYEGHIYGKGLRDSSSKVETVPSFIGKKPTEVTSWAKERDVEVDIQIAKPGDAKFNENMEEGLITYQSVKAGTLAKDIHKITIYINGAKENVSTPEPEPEEDTLDIDCETNPDHPICSVLE